VSASRRRRRPFARRTAVRNVLVAVVCVPLVAALVGATTVGEPLAPAAATGAAAARVGDPQAAVATSVPASRLGAAQRASLDRRVGALFSATANNSHFCTASVVEGGGGDLVMTAAHCVYDPRRARGRAGLRFVPGYRNGRSPFGSWRVVSMTIDARWRTSGDPDLDVAFVRVAPNSARTLRDVVGVNRLDFAVAGRPVVRVTGYPRAADAPVACWHAVTWHSATQLRVACRGLATGTSGSPWVESFDPVRGQGLVVGLVAGFEGGGATDDVSYSPRLSEAVRSLYARAMR